MNEAGLWLTYLFGGVVSFGVAHFIHWKRSPATLLGATLSFFVWLFWPFVEQRSLGFDDPWFNVAAVINGAFCIAFAVVGAIIGYETAAARRS